MSDLVTLLQALRIEEVSLVDHPASELEGWMIQKRRDGTSYRVREPQCLADIYANIRVVAAAEGVDRATMLAACRKAEAAAIKAQFGAAGLGLARPSADPRSPGAARKQQRRTAVVESGGSAALRLRAHLRSGR